MPLTGLENRSVLVTGGASGIGRATVERTAFLLSDEAPFITGAVYPIDGGELA